MELAVTLNYPQLANTDQGFDETRISTDKVIVMLRFFLMQDKNLSIFQQLCRLTHIKFIGI